MKWLNIKIDDLTAPEFLGSEPTNRATWLCLLRYCCQRENSGVIQNCNAWGDRKWMQLVGVTKDEIHRESMLWNLNDGDLSVWKYPIEQQKGIAAKRIAGATFGRGKGKPKPVQKPKAPAKPVKKITPPTIEEFRAYCNKDLAEYGLDADNIYRGYLENDWKDSRDNPIKNWKTKLRQVWCKAENKKQVVPERYDTLGPEHMKPENI